MNYWALALCLVSFFSSNLHAQTPKHFSITYFDYPYIKGYTELFDEIYTELGFTVTLIATPSLRGLILVNQGSADADVARIGAIAKNYDNLIVVQPELTRGYLTLICARDVPCSKEILVDSRIPIMTANQVTDLLGSDEFKALKVNISSLLSVPELLKAKRYEYAILLLDHMMEKRFSNDFQLVKIKEMSVSHIINKKYQHLLPQIEDKLREKLPDFIQNRN